ncbi:hypothetical protein AB0873_29140 [Micromonospora sp. NPDC047707]|uniref:hypothetical protein n=1 Tax=Micromonospora sp. NPDC047707 TaxID=3154498 RepID=UPI00345475E6
MAEGAGQGHNPRIAKPQGRGPATRRINGGVRDPLKGWTREDAALTDTFSLQDSPVAGTGLGLQVVEVVQAGLAAQVAGAVDDGLDAHGAAVFEVLLDAGVPVEHVEQDVAVVAAVDGGAERADGVAAYPAAEDDFDVVESAEVEVVGDEGFEEAAGVAGCVEYDGAGDLDLAQPDLFLADADRRV